MSLPRSDIMGPKDYILDRIDGEYAYLKDVESGNEIFIALALLPIAQMWGAGFILKCLNIL